MEKLVQASPRNIESEPLPSLERPAFRRVGVLDSLELSGQRISGG
jgi:hypothetical protein